MNRLKIYVYDDQGNCAYPFTGRALPTIILDIICGIIEKGFDIVADLKAADVALAPLLKKKISEAQIEVPRYGTLVFHPSLLPRHRGRDAIKWAFDAGESYTGATWFWADNGYDTGDICEQEVLEISRAESPREFYNRAVIPSAIGLLEYALQDLAGGHVRRRPQREEAATYEKPFKSVLE